VVRFAGVWDDSWVTEAEMDPRRMDRSKVKIIRMIDAPEEEKVEGEIGDRLAMVWPLTMDVMAFTGSFDAESRLRRDVVRLLGP
jgi:hypothetical protein